MRDYLVPFLTILAMNIPVYLIWGTGVILAIINWRHHKEISLVALIAFGLLFLMSLINASQSLLALYLTRGLEYSYGRASMVSGIIGIIGQFVYAAIWVLVLIAIFGWRKARPSSGEVVSS